jgi:hypothetical protein
LGLDGVGATASTHIRFIHIFSQKIYRDHVRDLDFDWKKILKLAGSIK